MCYIDLVQSCVCECRTFRDYGICYQQCKREWHCLDSSGVLNVIENNEGCLISNKIK